MRVPSREMAKLDMVSPGWICVRVTTKTLLPRDAAVYGMAASGRRRQSRTGSAVPATAWGGVGATADTAVVLFLVRFVARGGTVCGV